MADAAYYRNWRANNSERYLKQQRERRAESESWPEQNRHYSRNYMRRLKAEVIEKLGGKCACCTEATREFLEIDHIKGGGTQERKTLSNWKFLDKIRREGYPKDQYRVLCANCNRALGAWGYCPHGNLVSESEFVTGAPRKEV